MIHITTKQYYACKVRLIAADDDSFVRLSRNPSRRAVKHGTRVPTDPRDCSYGTGDQQEVDGRAREGQSSLAGFELGPRWRGLVRGSDQPRRLQIIINEIRVLEKISQGHPNIVKLVDYFEVSSELERRYSRR